MSGGVDSSVTAHILQQKGCDVWGIFITIRNPSHIPCTSTADKQDAMRACAALGMPFREYDATAQYQEKVIEPFVEAYRHGETPNPDVLCNQYIKFDAVFSYAKSIGCSHIATGHYAQVNKVGTTNHLCQSVDTDKDQTYFMYTISQDALNHLLLPVGGYTKQQVRERATDAALPAAKKKDSTGLCFLGDISMKEFLSAYIDPQEGQVVLADGRHPIGVHEGVWFYTLGQRHGFTITEGPRVPYVVVGKDTDRNELLVAQNEQEQETGLCRYKIRESIFRRIPKTTDTGQSEGVFARFRHRGKLIPVTLSIDGSTVESVLGEAHMVAPGQSAVVYTADGECIGGGVVSEVSSAQQSQGGSINDRHSEVVNSTN